MTHFVNAEILKQYRKLRNEAGPRYDVVLLYHVTAARQPEALPEDIAVFRFAQADLARQPYPNKPPVLSAFNVELFALHYARRHPWYAHYWVIEYDVRFSGPWSDLLDAFADNGADLLGTTLTRYDFAPAWPHWASVVVPGEGLPRARWIRGFFPLYRLSRAAVEELDEAYRRGWGGNFEAVMPTVLARAGLRVEDIGGDGPFVDPANRNRFYENTPQSANLWPGSCVFRPIRLVPGERPGRVWHPVRPPSGEGWAQESRQRLQRRARSWARGGE